MKKLRRLVLTLAIFLLLAMPVGASQITRLESTAAVSTGGDCQMALQFQLELDQAASQIVIPLGQNASNVTVNGAKVRLKTVDGVRSVVLKSDTGFSGTQSLTLNYTVSGVVGPETDWQLRLPLLPGGMEWPVEELSFSVTMPGEFSQTPSFTSGYYGADVDNYMEVSVSGAVISGRVNTQLKDHDSLMLTMAADETMFPRNHTVGQTLSFDRLAMLACLLLAVVYWLLTLSWMPPRVLSQPQPPVGFTAGEVVSRLRGGHTDLALMCLTWAQKGYLSVHMSEDHTVTLQKLMEMGNERSSFEQQTFRALFGKGDSVSAASGRFRALARQVPGADPGVRTQFAPKSGNPLVVQVLCALGGGFAGVAMADRVAPGGVSRWALLILGGLGAGIACWLLQKSLRSALIPNPAARKEGVFGLAAGGVLAAGGLISGSVLYALGALGMQALAAVLTMFGGRRNETGKATVQNMLGLRRYLRTADSKQLRRIAAQNRDYYYDLAPFALALGVDRAFAARFSGYRQPECNWLLTDFPQPAAARRWNELLREVVEILRFGTPGSARGRRRATEKKALRSGKR